jgi:DNA sulfur modification protein DndD
LTLDELVVDNFGIYRDRHVIALTPPSKNKPIVLFGGLNGAGKTTLLDALQLGLHGKRAKCSNRGSGSYEDFLRTCINRFADAPGGASIEVHFHHVTDGRDQSYRVRRSWRENGSGLKENIDVFVNGNRDAAVSDAWAEYAEEFIPARLSHLFFFDGEKIEALADLDNASELLRSGIHSLLGLDVVDRLVTDLDVVASRKNKQLKVDSTAAAVIEQAQGELSGLTSQRDELVQKLASVQSQLEQSEYLHRKVVARLQSEGGELFNQKNLLEVTKARLETEIQSLDAQLREDASGAAPLLLVSDLLDGIHERARHENTAASAKMLGGVLQERDTLVIDSLRDSGAKATLVRTISELLERDRKARTQAARSPRYLSLSESAQAQLHELRTSGLPHLRTTATERLARRDQLMEELAVSERKLSMVPDEDAIAPMEAERKALEETSTKLTRDHAKLQEELRVLDNEIARKQAVAARLREQAMRSELEQEDVARVKDHSVRAQAALNVFRQRVIERHIASIQDYVLESFRYLVRKKALLSEVRIDPHTFAVELRGGDGKLMKPDRLSAGERQLLAVSLLWGLAKASRRPLPAIIDTPLGRLDSSHRKHLVERYFPHASHQVLLLSTDEEIRGRYLEAIRPSVGHSYLLEFDEAERSSVVKPGYFLQEKSHAS